MKIASIIARYLLGLMFLIFGLNGFLHFIPMAMPPGIAGQFMGALFESHYTVAIYGVQVISAILFLAGRYVPLALTLIGPVIVNILLVHILMLPQGLPLALLVAILWFLVFARYRASFSGIFQS